MEIKSGDLGDDLKNLVLKILDVLPHELKNNTTASDIWYVLIQHLETLNVEVINDQHEIEQIPDLERYTEHKVHHQLVEALLKNPVLYEAITYYPENQPGIRRRFTLPIFKVNI